MKDKRQRFLARAATAQWDCIIITHSAFKFIPCPADFERRLITQQMQSYPDLLERVDGADRLSRKRIERMKEGLEEEPRATQIRKDDMLTIAEIGVDQLIVDEMQEFRSSPSRPTRRRREGRRSGRLGSGPGTSTSRPATTRSVAGMARLPRAAARR